MESVSKEEPSLQIKTDKKEPTSTSKEREIKQNTAKPKDVPSPSTNSDPSDWVMLYDQNTGYYYYWNKVLADN